MKSALAAVDKPIKAAVVNSAFFNIKLSSLGGKKIAEFEIRLILSQ